MILALPPPTGKYFYALFVREETRPSPSTTPADATVRTKLARARKKLRACWKRSVLMNEALLPVVNGWNFFLRRCPRRSRRRLCAACWSRERLRTSPARRRPPQRYPPSCRTQRLRLKNAGVAFADGAACGPFWRLRWPCAPVQPSSVRYSILLP